MSPLERIHYLANILSLTSSQVHEWQEATLENICHEIQADKNELLQAYQLQKENYQLQLVGRYEQQICNFADMLFFVLSTGNLNDAKKELLLNFAQPLGITQTQLQRFMQEAKNRCQWVQEWRKCQACSTQIPANSKFCPTCGESQQKIFSTDFKKDTTNSSDFQVPSKGLALLIDPKHQDSQTLKKDYKLKTISYLEKEWLYGHWQFEMLMEILPLFNSLSIDLIKIFKGGQLTKWEDIFAFVPCAKQRQQTYCPEEHCFGLNQQSLNIWGCMHAKMNWQKNAEWLRYGYFDNKQLFILDKKKLRYHLEQHLQSYFLCPYLNQKKLPQIIQALPDKIMIDSKTWDYQTTDQETLGAYRLENPIRWAFGVSPLNLNLAIEIIKTHFPNFPAQKK